MHFVAWKKVHTFFLKTAFFPKESPTANNSLWKMTLRIADHIARHLLI